MPHSSRATLVLLEAAAAAVVVGLVEKGTWLVVGIAVAAVLLLAAVPWRGRPVRHVLRSWLAMRGRNRRARGHGLASLVGGTYDVVTVERGSGGVTVGAVRDGTTWSVPLALPLLGVLNDDPPVPLDRLATLLTVEDVPLSSVRLVTLVTPGAAGVGRLATRYLVLTLDTAYAAAVIAERGGTPAVHQILRRCVLRAEEVLNASGVAIRRLPAGTVEVHSAGSLGPVAAGPDGAMPGAVERPDHVLLASSMSTTYAVTGDRALEGLGRLAASLPLPMVATAVALQPGPPPHRAPTLQVLVRLSGPAAAVQAARAPLEAAARELGLRVHRLVRDQVPQLRATTLLGVPAEVS